MNKLYILYAISFIILATSIGLIIYYNFTKNKNTQNDINKMYNYVFQKMKNGLLNEPPYDLEPSNLNMLYENIETISSCTTLIFLENLKKNNINYEKFIKNNLSKEESQKFENSLENEYKERLSKCAFDNQLEAVEFLSTKEKNISVSEIEYIEI